MTAKTAIPSAACPAPAAARHSQLRDLDYSVVQQCMHCGLCLPTCPTYDATKSERNSPRGRIALMRSIADGRLEATPTFADEMYFCLGCLACMTACPAGVNYAELFEHARAEAEESGVLQSPKRSFIRWLTMRWLFMDLGRLRLAGVAHPALSGDRNAAARAPVGRDEIVAAALARIGGHDAGHSTAFFGANRFPPSRRRRA